MIYKLVCAGDNHFNQLYEKDDNEIIVAIDGGYKALKEKNIKIDYFFGDYDSLGHDDIECVKKFEYPVMKDKGDFELAIDYLINVIQIKQDDKVLVYNATGGRLDHYYSILNTIKKYKQYDIYLVDKNNTIYFKNNIIKLNKSLYKYISFFSINDNTIITIKGCKYNIENYNLKIDDNLCLSNEIITQCEVITNEYIIIIESN